MRIWLALGVILTTLNLEAKVFRNAYVAFELPDTWKCTLEHTEWVCRSEGEKDAKEAIIVLTAKEVGPTDSLDAYIQHLGTPQAAHGQPGGSKVVYPPKQVKINDHVWVDGLQMGSEVPNYFTRYLASIKDRIAVLVTFSAHKNFYTKYSQDFFKGVMSLRVIAAKNLLATPEMGPLRPGAETLGAPIGSALQTELSMAEGMAEGQGAQSQGQKTKMMFMGIAVLLAAAAFYVFFKMKNR